MAETVSSHIGSPESEIVVPVFQHHLYRNWVLSLKGKDRCNTYFPLSMSPCDPSCLQVLTQKNAENYFSDTKQMANDQDWCPGTPKYIDSSDSPHNDACNEFGD